jgi:hypothetical protein
MGEQELLDQAERASAELRMQSLAKEGRHPWLEVLALCAVAAVAVIVGVALT